MKIDYRQNGTVIAQISDDLILNFVKSSVKFYKSEPEGYIMGQELKDPKNFIEKIKKYLLWYLSENLSKKVDDVEILLEADLNRFVSDSNYAQEIFSENFDIIPSMGIKFWQVPFDQWIDEENIDFFFSEVQKILEEK